MPPIGDEKDVAVDSALVFVDDACVYVDAENEDTPGDPDALVLGAGCRRR